MAKGFKRNEFKPDSSGERILNKLMLTKRQRQSLLKWVLFAALLLVLLIVQDVIMSRVKIFGVTTDLVSCAILLICVTQGGEVGAVFTLIASSLYVFSGSAPGTYSIVLLTVPGVVAAIFRQAYLRKSFSAAFACAGAALLVYEMGVFAINLFLEYTTFSRIGAAGLTGLVTLAVMPALYPIVQSIGKIGGETWKE